MYTYNFNPHGTDPSCNIVSEAHQLTAYNASAYYFVIPKYAPFHACSIDVHDGDGNELVEGTDFNLIMPYVSATRACGKPIYAGISFNTHANMTVLISYMTIGGRWVSDSTDVWRNLAEQTYNPRLTYYDTITGVPGVFPPIEHSVQHRDFDEFGTILTEVGKIAQSIDRSQTNSHVMEYLIDTRSNKFSQLKQKQLELEARILSLEST